MDAFSRNPSSLMSSRSIAVLTHASVGFVIKII